MQKTGQTFGPARFAFLIQAALSNARFCLTSRKSTASQQAARAYWPKQAKCASRNTRNGRHFDSRLLILDQTRVVVMRMSSSIAEFRQEIYYGPPLCARDPSPLQSWLFFAHIKQLAAIVIALGFGFGLWFGVSNYTAPRSSYPYPGGMTYIGNGIYQLPDGTYTGDIPPGTDTSYWNNVVYPIGYPYGFSGGTINNPMYYYNAITGACGSLEGGEDGKQYLIAPQEFTERPEGSFTFDASFLSRLLRAKHHIKK